MGHTTCSYSEEPFLAHLLAGIRLPRGMEQGKRAQTERSPDAGNARIQAARRNVLVNAVDPGWVRSDMGGPSAPRSLEQGADTIVWCATLPDGGPIGGFYHDRKPIQW